MQSPERYRDGGHRGSLVHPARPLYSARGPGARDARLSPAGLKKDWETEVVATSRAEKSPRRSRAERRADSIRQILDSAEELFAERGFHGVSLKDIAAHAGVHHTLVHYYFDDKNALVDAVFARRAPVSSKRRADALEAYEDACGGAPTVEGALHAFLDTDLDLYIEGGPGWRNYGALSAQVANTPEWGAELMDQHFDPVVLRLIGLLKKALPHASEENIFWGYHFVSGALMLTLARTGRIDKLSGGLCKSDDYAAVKSRMAQFMAAGFQKICGPAPDTKD